MKKGKCIYCNKEKDLNEEHAFPKFLLQIPEGAPEWTIKEHLCEKCNGELGKLDKILEMRGPIGHTWSQIKSELGQENENQQSLRYNQNCYKLEPDRAMVPEHALGNRIGMFKLLVEKSSENDTTSNSIENSLDPVVPQIILTLYAKWQQLEKTRRESAEKFDSLDIIPCNDKGFEGSIYWIGNGKIILPAISDSDILAPIFPIENPNFVHPSSIFPANATATFPFPYTWVFPPKAAEYFFDRPRDFQFKLLRNPNWICSDLIVVIDGKNKKHGKAKYFINSVKSDHKDLIDKGIYLKQATFANISKTKMIRGRFVTDGNAELYIERAIAKIGFHCFLYHYSNEFNGHEFMFDGIKSFIFKGEIANSFVTNHNDFTIENSVYSSNRHFHYIKFFRYRQNIGCQIHLFTGLLRRPFSFNITLAGKIENLNDSPDKIEKIPYYVSAKSKKKKRLYLADNLELIQKTNVDDLGVIQKPSPKDIIYFG